MGVIERTAEIGKHQKGGKVELTQRQ